MPDFSREEVERVAKGLSQDKAAALIAEDIDPLRGLSSRLIRIAPGWGSWELNDLGLAVRQHLIGTGDGGKDAR